MMICRGISGAIVDREDERCVKRDSGRECVSNSRTRGCVTAPIDLQCTRQASGKV